MKRVLHRRTSARLLVAAGVGCLTAAVLPVMTAGAADEGAGLSSFSLAANAPAVQIRQVDGGNCGGEPASTGGCEGVIPEAVSTLRNGPVGYALASVVWPGVLAGNLGSLLIVAGDGQIPNDAKALNTPVRAEARSGGDDKEVVNETYPGARMVAQATDIRVNAEATVKNGASSPAGTSGESTGKTATYLIGPKTAVAEAASSAKDLSLAAGVVTIGSVTSEAKATTDGVKADATGRTVTSGVKIAGIPVTIDERGVTVNGNNAPVTAATTLVNTAIAGAGMTIAVSQPTKVVEGASVSYDSGSVVFFWTQSPGNSMTVILGGTRVTATAAPEFAFGGTGGDTGGTTGFTPVPGGTTTGGTTVPPVLGTDPVPIVPPTSNLPPAVVAPNGPVEGVLAAARLPLPDGLPPALIALGLLGAGFVAAGFRRLPDRVLEAPASVCLLEEAL